MTPGAAGAGEPSVLERTLWGRVRFFGGWGVFAACLAAVAAVLLSDVASAGLSGATFLTKYGPRPLRPALALALAGPLVGAWVAVLAPLARRGAAGGVLLGVLGVLPLLVVGLAVSGGAVWSWDEAPWLAGMALGAGALGYSAHLQHSAQVAGKPLDPAA